MRVSRRTILTAATAGAVIAGTGAAGYVAATRERPEPPAPPATDKHGHLVWRNWSGIQHSYPQLRMAPTSEEQLAGMLQSAPPPIRAVGAGHSFMPLVPTDGTLLTLDEISGLVSVDGDEATILAGTRLDDLGPALAGHGRAMANLPDINKQSLAGALSTATHGTGEKLRAIHGDVTGLRLVTAKGDILDCSAAKNPDLFNAARVSLGSMGIITQVTLKTVPAKNVIRRVWLERFEDSLARAEQRWKTHRNFEFYVVPFTGLCANISNDETDEAPRPRGPETDSEFLDVLKILRNVLGFSTPLRKAAAEALLSAYGAKPEVAVDQGWKLLSTARPVRFNEMEYHLPAEQQFKALREVVAVIEAKRPDVFFPIELRRIATDDAWLSPFQGGLHGSLAVHAYYKDDYDFFFTLIEPILRKHGGRPHWGKLNSLKNADFAALYPRWNDFHALRKSLDPEERLLNPYMKAIMAG